MFGSRIDADEDYAIIRRTVLGFLHDLIPPGAVAEWPSLSEITLGLTPARTSCEAWEWRRSWNRTFGIFRRRSRSRYGDVNAEGGQKLPSSRQQIRSLSSYSGPRTTFRFSCSWR